jgi:myo-inositol-1-phosphate synthase
LSKKDVSSKRQGRRRLSKINIAIVGVGNCASALVQGLCYYEKAKTSEDSLGLRHLFLGGFHPRDIRIVAAFDIDQRKVGRDLSEAIFAQPNTTPKLVEVPWQNVTVQKGPVLDGISQALMRVVKVSPREHVDVVETLMQCDAEIVVDLLPSGAVKASQWYADQAIKAGCAFINATPVFIASDALWARKFEEACLPVVGDDLIDQVGATTLHKTLLGLLSEHGVRIIETYQLDVGGGTESLDTLERTRKVKRIVKTRSVSSALPYEAEVVAGSTDYVDFLGNQRDSYFWIKGIYFCRAPMRIDLRLTTMDSPNAGSPLFDVIRAVKIALQRGMKGAIQSISAYAFKQPPRPVPQEMTEEMFQSFIKGED